MSKPKVSMIQYRRASLVGKPEGRRMAAALSSELPVPRIFGDEVLVHTQGAVNMERAASGLPLLVNHARDALPIGRVEGIHLGNDMKLRGDLVFSEATQEARDAFSLVEEGTLGDVSISYRVDEWERGESKDEIRVTKWTPLEASLVSVPADGSVGVGRNLDDTATENQMSEETVQPEVATPASDDIVTQIRQRSSAGFQAGAEAEGIRLAAIVDLAANMRSNLPDLAPQFEELERYARDTRSVTVEKFRSLVLELIGGNAAPLTPAGTEARAPAPMFAPPGVSRQPLIQAGADHVEKQQRGMELSLLERAGTPVSEEEMRGNTFRNWSLMDFARQCLENAGMSLRGMSTEQIARAAIAQGSRAIEGGAANYQTSNFTNVTENVITKRVHDAYAAAPVTWDRWCSSIEVPDFKQFTIPRLSQISDLPVVAENATYVDLTQVDQKEAATLVKHGGLMSFSWEAIVNDDQRMFARTSQSMGEAAARTVDKKAYAVLTDNGLMNDGVALFALGHNNLGAGALDFDNIVVTRTAMARQTDDNSIALGIDLRYLLVPEELRDTADNLAGSEYLPWTEASPGAQRVNTIRSTFTVVPTIRLTDATDWYGASANGGTVEMAFLSGNRMPMLFREDGWSYDTLNWKIRHPSVAYAVDWRGLYHHAVAG